MNAQANKLEEISDDLPAVSELDQLKDRARMMGIKIPNNVSVATLAQKIEEKLNTSSTKEAKSLTRNQLRALKKQEASRLVRCRISCMNPLKADLGGEVFSVGNNFVGNYREMVPFGEKTDNGWHIPYIIYKHLRERKFLQIKTVKDAKGRDHIEKNWVKEFSIDVLPQLTEQELKDLAIVQRTAGLF